MSVFFTILLLLLNIMLITHLIYTHRNAHIHTYLYINLYLQHLMCFEKNDADEINSLKVNFEGIENFYRK
jgi:hypothetical protein